MTDKDIIQKFPKVFGTAPFDYRTSLIGFGFEVPEKWLPSLEQLFSKINDVIQTKKIRNFKVVQVKEKFGTLRVYVQNSTDEIDDLIRIAEYTIGD